MAPVGKEGKAPNGEASTRQPSQSRLSAVLHDDSLKRSHTAASPPADQPSESQIETATPRPSVQPRGSWGSWRAKASPVAQVARESVSVEQGVSSESPRIDHQRQSISKSARGSRKSVPLVANITRVHATSDSNDKSLPERKPSSSEEKNPVLDKENIEVETSEMPESKSTPQDGAQTGTNLAKVDGMAPDGNDGADAQSVEFGGTRPQSTAWLGWWSRPEGYASDGEKVKSVKRPRLTNDHEPTPNVETPKTEEPDPLLHGQKTHENAELGSAKPEMTVNPASTRSWFGFWSTAQNEQAAEENNERRRSEQMAEAEAEAEAAENSDTQAAAVPDADQKSAKTDVPVTADANEAMPTYGKPKTSGWAFWSADKPKETPQVQDDAQKQVGEIAVANTPSQSHPEAAQFNEQREAKKSAPKKADTKKKAVFGPPKPPQPIRLEGAASENALASEPKPSDSPMSVQAQIEMQAQDPTKSPAPVQKGKRAEQLRPSLTLPSVRDTYPLEPNPGYLERLTSYVAQTLHFPGSQTVEPPKHVFLASTPARVKKAIAVGVHGFFPGPLFQKVLGPPTGTSVRFANHAAAAIKEWCQSHQPQTKDIEIEKIALEGEGLIADRVDTLWKLLLNWLAHLRQADFVLVACHSQGVPVGIMLVAKLIQLGCLAPNVRVGVCAMAGINLGPFVEYKSRFFGGSALELFDFCTSTSKVSVAYAHALEICLRQGVRISYIGSLDDQLVSLESSLNIPVVHPYINRSVFIDGRLHALNFLTRLVVFAVKLRNLGLSDHGLVREVSAPLAGSLVGGEGHSRIYDEPTVYQTAIQFALETTPAAPSAFSQQPTPPLPADDPAKAREAALQQRASLSSYPASTTLANHMRRGSLASEALRLPGIAPVFGAYDALVGTASAAATAAEKNPFVLPWAVRGMLEEDIVKKDESLKDEVRVLVRDFENWKPATKVLKDVRWRLEGVRSML